jgi:prepilin-type N-terminal cleavage/methylation domain-containing protein
MLYVKARERTRGSAGGATKGRDQTVSSARPAFTLVEILIVVIILGILAGIVIPNITSVTTISRETNLKENLSKIRAHIQVYRNQHADFPSGDDFGAQMTKRTNFTGGTSDTRTDVYRFGPYLEQMPPNPITSTVAVRKSTNPAEAFPPGDADGGWWYNEVTGAFFADLKDSHADQDGNPYNHY